MSGPPESSDYNRRQRETMLTVLMIIMVGGGFMLFMDVVTFGFTTAALMVGFLLGLLGCLQYLLWGHRFSQQVQKEREAYLREEEEKQKTETRPWERQF